MSTRMPFRAFTKLVGMLVVFSSGCGFDPDQDVTYFPCIGGTACPYGDCACLDGAICVPREEGQSPSSCYPPDACLEDSECDDGDDCTIDLCIDFQCEHKPLDDPDRCSSGIEVEAPMLPAIRVYPGQVGLRVLVRVTNRDNQARTVTGCTLGFFRRDQDVATDYTVDGESEFPVPIAPGKSHLIRLSVDVSGQAMKGPVEIGAMIRLEGLNPVESRASSTWVVTGTCDVIRVTTVDDEDDTGGQADVASAGGELDVSLREALLIANARENPSVIRFDPEIFPPKMHTSVHLSTALGALPAITRNDIWLDGTGSSVFIDGAALESGVGLEILAHDVGVKEIHIAGFTAEGGSTCMRSEQVDGVQVIDCTLENCGPPHVPAPGLLLQGGLNHVVSGSRVSGSSGGIYLYDSPVGAIIRNNSVLSSSRSGIYATGSLHRIDENLMDSSYHSNLQLSGVEDVQVSANTISGSQTQHGVDVIDGSTGVIIAACEIVGNDGNGVRVETGSSNVTVTRSNFGGNFDAPIFLEAGANEDVAPPSILSFDGLVVTGTAPVEAEIVEVYVANEGLTFLAETDVLDGQWELALETSVQKVRVIATTREGSTSAFSETVGPTQDLVVSTASDELDGGEDIYLVDQAGGAGDLSLREAIVIANNRQGPDEIRFDPDVFPSGGGVTILVGAGNMGGSSLPALTDPGTVLQGEGVTVVLDGGEFTEADSALVRLQADTCAVEGITIQNVSTPGSSGIRLISGRGLRVERCELIDCGTTGTGAGMYLGVDADGASLVGNSITGGNTSIYSNHAGNLLVADNEVSHATSACIQFVFTNGIAVNDNIVHDCGTTGIDFKNGYSENAIVGNRVWNNGGTGIQLDLQAAVVSFNSMVLNRRGISLTRESTIGMQNNLLAHNTEVGVQVSVPGVLNEVHNLFFDNGGDGVTGDNAFSGLPDYLPALTDVLADPLLVDSALGDLTPTAAAIDAGIDIGVDRNGDAPGRFNGEAPDIGAVETE